MVYYRKYRPQKISELDSKEVREKLFSLFPASPAGGSKELSVHAFLFTGSKGLGKTSTARIIAKVVNCDQRLKIKNTNQKSKIQIKNQKLEDQIEPCNECTQCISITNGTNLDVLEIDGASNRGIDEIRDLREKIRLAPIAARKKVYIIDEVHMLTTEAFNALLKTLEEPPPHAIFILCTTEFHKVPETIISRCFHIFFNKATSEELVHSLKRIAEGEHLKVDKEVLEEISRLSDGGFRDGTKILEELAFLSRGEPITLKLLEEKYQISNIQYQTSKMIGFIVHKDTKRAMNLVSELVNLGIDMKYFIEQMINILHEELLVELEVIQNHQSPITNHQLTLADIKRLVELLTKAHGELKYAVLPQLPLELVILEWAIQRTDNRGRITDSSEIAKTENTESGILLNPSFRNQSSVFRTPSSDKWLEFVNKVKAYNHSIAGVLRSCSLGEISDSQLVIKAGYKFHKEKLEDKKALEILEKSWEELTGNKVKVMIELKK